VTAESRNKNSKRPEKEGKVLTATLLGIQVVSKDLEGIFIPTRKGLKKILPK
jgi:hypothetical protein